MHPNGQTKGLQDDGDNDDDFKNAMVTSNGSLLIPSY